MKNEDIELIQQDNEGIAKVLTAIAELYRVANDKTIVDDVLKRYNHPIIIINNPDIDQQILMDACKK